MKALWTRVAIVLIACAIHANSLRGEFLNYDDGWIVQNPQLTSWLTPSGLRKTFFDLSHETRMDHGAEYLPVRDLSAALQYRLFGERAWAYHTVQIVLFALATLGLTLLLSELGAPLVAQWGFALLFAAHPIHAEPIAWLSSHKDLLSLFFVTLSLLSYQEERRRPALVFFLLACASKYSALVAVPLFPLIDRALARRVSRSFLATVTLLSLAWIALITRVGEAVSYANLNVGRSFVGLVRNAFAIFYESLAHLILPDPLQIYYPYSPALSWGDMRVGWGALGALFLMFLGFFGRKRLGVPVALILVGFLPMFRAPQMHLLADRYLLFSSIGFCWIVAEMLALLAVPRIAWVTIGILTAMGSVLTWRQEGVWRTSDRLWAHAAAARRPVHPNVLESFAVSLRDQGEWARSAATYREFLERDISLPRRAMALTNLGYVEVRAGHPVEAERALRAALKIDPSSAIAHLNLGAAYALQEKRAEARKELEMVLRSDPRNVDAHLNLARLAVEEKRWSDARTSLRALEKLVPNDPRVQKLREVLK